MPRDIATIHFVFVYFLSDRHGEFVSLHMCTVSFHYFELKAPLLVIDLVG